MRAFVCVFNVLNVTGRVGNSLCVRRCIDVCISVYLPVVAGVYTTETRGLAQRKESFSG